MKRVLACLAFGTVAGLALAAAGTVAVLLYGPETLLHLGDTDRLP